MTFAGFDGALVALTSGDGNSSQSIVLDQVTCLGDEPALSQCPARNLGTHNCYHYQDAGVICQCEWCEGGCVVGGLCVLCALAVGVHCSPSHDCLRILEAGKKNFKCCEVIQRGYCLNLDFEEVG